MILYFTSISNYVTYSQKFSLRLRRLQKRNIYSELLRMTHKFFLLTCICSMYIIICLSQPSSLKQFLKKYILCYFCKKTVSWKKNVKRLCSQQLWHRKFLSLRKKCLIKRRTFALIPHLLLFTEYLIED